LIFLKQIFLQKAFDANALDNAGWSILHYSLFYGHFEIAEYILNFTSVNKNEELILSCLILSPFVEHGRLEMLKSLIEKYGVYVLEKHQNYRTLLHLVAQFGNMNIFDYLAETQNMNVNQKDSYGNTPILHMLQTSKLSEIDIYKNVQHLVEVHHVDVDVNNAYGKNAFEICFQRNFTTIAHYIMISAILKVVLKEVLETKI